MKTKLTYREVLHGASSFLESQHLDGYVAERFLVERQGWTKTDLVLHLTTEIPTCVQQQLEQDVADFVKGRPVQHILGYEWFYERKFNVTKDTLIPRPETEEIIAKYLERNQEQPPLTVLDIGTGTGIIGITVKRERPEDTVTAIDISPEALQVAEENAQILGADIRFLLGDLTEPVGQEKFDRVISNPPYISEAERPLVDDIVLENEPHLALFAENDGLLIYQRLAKELPSLMNPAGEIILEIGFQQGAAVKALFMKAFPQAQVEVEKDLSGLDRMIYVQLP
ncbi:peptide chain release factor N(5)-glutamine methyltransferase [Carnobacterium gallinarum]|uniref:peptide chain release factor N(5)-glutamine methyltransferase n=1 Tax=Carnobacterium gallinarum TaxID=2749 RepID=UPI000556D8A5|nr:peptide chain release factor N(5)-glutamine methyltransferase [Carnobacterium gallinarum]